jgi:hypothetical protein
MHRSPAAAPVQHLQCIIIKIPTKISNKSQSPAHSKAPYAAPRSPLKHLLLKQGAVRYTCHMDSNAYTSIILNTPFLPASPATGADTGCFDEGCCSGWCLARSHIHILDVAGMPACSVLLSASTLQL